MTIVHTDHAALHEAAHPDTATARAQRLLAGLVPMALTDRADRVRAKLADAECDALLVTKLVNVRWLCGFTGSAGMVLVDADGLHFVTDGRYDTQAHHQLAEAGVDAAIFVGRTGAAQRDHVAEIAKAIGRVGLEAEAVSWAAQRRYAEEWFPEAELVATERLVDDMRIVKDEGEIARIEAACAVADAALARVRLRLAEEPTESDFALELDSEMRRLGASGTSFETICAGGPNAAMPHHRPGDRRLREGDLVVLDFGALVDGYCSDMSRTVMLGDPSATQARMLAVVAASQRAGVEAVAADVEASAVDATCRTVIDDAGWADAFSHSTGHGVGLEIHEAPGVSKVSTATLARGAIVTVEPGVYLPEHGGVRIEDTVVVTPDGCRPLTLAPKATAVA